MSKKTLGAIAIMLRIFIDERRYGMRPLHIGEVDID